MAAAGRTAEQMFRPIRRVSIRLMVTFYLLDIALVLSAVALFATNLLDDIERASKGLVNVTLVVNVAIIVIMVGGVLFGIGRLRPRDVGLVWSNIPAALAMTIFLWLSAQVVQGFIQLVQSGTVTTELTWTMGSASVLFGCLLAQLFGNALYEEVAFRGFLLPQVYLKLERWHDRSRLRLVIALVISQGMFALVHIPIRVYVGTDLVSLPQNLLYLLFLGSFFAFIYMRTGNLFFAVGVHSLLNAPTAALGSNNSVVILGLGLALTLLWPFFVPRAGDVRPPVAVPQH